MKTLTFYSSQFSDFICGLCKSRIFNVRVIRQLWKRFIWAKNAFWWKCTLMGSKIRPSDQVSFLVWNPQNVNLTLLDGSVCAIYPWLVMCNGSYSILTLRWISGSFQVFAASVGEKRQKQEEIIETQPHDSIYCTIGPRNTPNPCTLNLQTPKKRPFLGGFCTIKYFFQFWRYDPDSKYEKH